MRFEQLEGESAVAAAAVDQIAATLQEKPDARIIVPAGRTPLPIYAELVRRAQARTLDASRACFVQLDEYVGCGPRDPRSFHLLLRRRLLDPLKRAPEQDRLIDGAARDARAEIERHAARLAQEGGADLCLLGIGRNGHVGFNEPGTSLDQRAHPVALARATREVAEAEFGAGKAPTHGITLGLHEIHSARRIVVLATGAGKASILAALFNEPPSSARPASLLLGHAGLVIFVDVAAAAQLHRPDLPLHAGTARGGAPAGR